uniref:Synaptobrevin, longin-like domain protein n=1 Tax=Tanacetum cinerariifolium TaxID=118510 RepID=A0A6L2KUZ4_TANCI|nr:hypothetical protein [Tanacetum cinerariifolium]
MALTFADTHNMIAFLTKSDTSEGFEQIIDFLNASVIQYALMVNPTIYVSCIKQFWSSVSIKKTHDVVRLQALIDRRKVIITEHTVRQALYLDDADSIDCLPNEEIFVELARMGYEKPSTKLTFYKAFFSTQWKFLIHTILQCMSAKRTAWNEFSSSMASDVICLATGRKFNFLKYIFDSLVRNVDSPSKFYMYPRFLQLMNNAQITDISSHNTKYTSPALIQKVFANMRRVGKGFSGVDTLLFEGMLVPQQVHDNIDAAAEDEDAAEPTPPSPTPAATPPPQQELIPSSLQAKTTPPPSPHQYPIAQPSSPPQQQPSQPTNIFMDLLNTLLETCTTLTRKVENLEHNKIAQALGITKLKQRVRRLEKKRGCIQTGGKIAELDADEDVTLEEVAAEVTKDADVQGRLEESQAQVYHLDLELAQKVLSMQDDETEPAKLIEVIKVVTTTKLMTEVVTAATTAAITITADPMPKASALRRIRGVIIHDLEETATLSVIVHSEPKFKDKGKGIIVEEPKPLKRQAQIKKDEVPIFEKHFNSIVAFLDKGEKEIEEEASKVIKRKSESSKEKAAKKQILDEEVDELKIHLQIVPSDEDDVYTEATPLALKVLVVDYQIHTDHNKPYYKIIRAHGTYQLFLSFISLLRNIDREDLEMLWKIVQERFAFLEPKNFSDDFLLNAFKTMFEKPNVKDNIWKNQRGRYRLAKVKSWKLLESCKVYIITFTTTQMILLVERRYHLTRFTLDQMLDNIRLEVEEESEVSLELLRFVRRQQQEGY